MQRFINWVVFVVLAILAIGAAIHQPIALLYVFVVIVVAFIVLLGVTQ